MKWFHEILIQFFIKFTFIGYIWCLQTYIMRVHACICWSSEHSQGQGQLDTFLASRMTSDRPTSGYTWWVRYCQDFRLAINKVWLHLHRDLGWKTNRNVLRIPFPLIKHCLTFMQESGWPVLNLLFPNALSWKSYPSLGLAHFPGQPASLACD